MQEEYDTIIIGAGMSGLGAGIRLAMFDKKVCILEKHTLAGGLNSWYPRGKRVIDTGLHAMTNYSVKGDKKKPLGKLLKQLRIDHDELDLVEQNYSIIDYPNTTLRFSNNIDELTTSIAEHFPKQVDAWNTMIQFIDNYDELRTEQPNYSARDFLAKHLDNQQLCDMLLCPLLSYGSAWEHDMEFNQFIIMFKAVFLQGFSRPKRGIKPIIDLLVKKFKSLGGEFYLKKGVSKLHTVNKSIHTVELENGMKLKCKNLLSCAGFPETMNLIEENTTQPQIGQLGFVESIFFAPLPKQEEGPSIAFHTTETSYQYRNPPVLFDKKSALLSFPHHFNDIDHKEATYRLTSLANYELWSKLSKNEYKEAKKELADFAFNKIQTFAPHLKRSELLFEDTFTPLTVKRFTSRFNGAIYGSPEKCYDGKTPYSNLYLCGTDQGFLGITGAILSGITIANLYTLKD